MVDFKSKFEGLLKYMPAVVLVLLLVLLAERLADLTWKVWPQNQAVAATTSAIAANVTATPAQQGVSARQIANWHLFGKAEISKVNNKIPTNAPETRLRLTLKGVVASADNPSAIIASQKGPEKDYNLGDNIPGGAILREVYPDRVILERRGRYETLSLQRRNLTNKELVITE